MQLYWLVQTTALRQKLVETVVFLTHISTGHEPHNIKERIMRSLSFFGLTSLLALPLAQSALAQDGWSTEVRAEYRYFLENPSVAETVQRINTFYGLLAAGGFNTAAFPAPTALVGPVPERREPSLVIEPTYFKSIDANTSFSFKGFGRYEEMDDERRHWDIRELVVSRKTESGGRPLEVRVGIDKVFWGVAESNHLVDVVNQTDLVENIDREEKLGQPMVRITSSQNWGTVDFLILPYFRERNFAGPEGRLRPPTAFSVLPVRYESGAEQFHTDVALRWSQRFRHGDLGLHYFRGTNREPRVSQDRTVVTPQNPLGMVLNYDQMWQAGLDGTLLWDDWTFKAEFISRNTTRETFHASVIGVEYPLTGILGMPWDVNLFFERSTDSRGPNSAAILQNDNFAGARLALNDANSTQFRVGVMKDMGDGSRSTRVEASTRIFKGILLRFEGQFFNSVTQTNQLAGIQEDSYVQISFAHYF